MINMKQLTIIFLILASFLIFGCARENKPTITPPIEKHVYTPSGNDRFLLLELKESHFSLDIGKHIKNSLNSVEFIMPVSKEYYDAAKIGENILEGKGFRGASLFFSGSISNYKITVLDKADNVDKFKK